MKRIASRPAILDRRKNDDRRLAERRELDVGAPERRAGEERRKLDVGTLLDELERRDLKRGLVTMCAAGGMAPAIIIERV